jgi:hypothetical protein
MAVGVGFLPLVAIVISSFLYINRDQPSLICHHGVVGEIPSVN